MAAALDVEFTTAKTFIARAYLKLRVDNKIDAVVRHKSVHSFCGMRTSRRP